MPLHALEIHFEAEEQFGDGPSAHWEPVRTDNEYGDQEKCMWWPTIELARAYCSTKTYTRIVRVTTTRETVS